MDQFSLCYIYIIFFNVVMRNIFLFGLENICFSLLWGLGGYSILVRIVMKVILKVVNLINMAIFLIIGISIHKM